MAFDCVLDKVGIIIKFPCNNCEEQKKRQNVCPLSEYINFEEQIQSLSYQIVEFTQFFFYTKSSAAFFSQ